jgi:hypothetical protein
MEVSGHLHTPAALSTRKEPLVPIGEEAGWDPRAGLDAVVKRNIPTPCRDSKPPITEPNDRGIQNTVTDINIRYIPDDKMKTVLSQGTEKDDQNVMKMGQRIFYIYNETTHRCCVIKMWV